MLAKKRRRWWLWVTGMVLVTLCLLLYGFPASWLQSTLQAQLPGMQLEGLQGSLWHGSAERMSVMHGPVLGRLQWRLSRRILLGDMRLVWQLYGPQIAMHGTVSRLSNTQWIWRNIGGDIDLALLGSYLPIASQFGGRLQLHLNQARLQRGWPLTVDALGYWRKASVHSENSRLLFGDLSFRLNVRNAVLQVWLQDMGTGPLQLKGVAAISPLGWRLRVQARPRSKQPVMQHWLQRWGSADARGVVLVERGGGLAAMIPLPALH